MEYSIGELSRVVQLPVKTIRYYQEEGVLMPSRLDADSGYRYYDAGCVERARVVKKLREMDFSLAEIRDLLAAGGEDSPGAVPALERKEEELDDAIRRATAVRKELRAIVLHERWTEARAHEIGEAVVERSFESVTIGALRVRGRYADIAGHIGAVMSRFGRWAAGGPFTLHHEMEFREEDADFEVCAPLRRDPPAPGASEAARGDPGAWSVRDLPARRCLVTLHRGPYEEIGRSYARLLEHLETAKGAASLPIEEIYLTGPGMLVPPSPRRYLTEIRVPLA